MMIDDVLLQEVYSLREKLKIATKLLIDYGYEVNEESFLHSLNSVEFDQWIEEMNNV